jgi:hypothetical protein
MSLNGTFAQILTVTMGDAEGQRISQASCEAFVKVVHSMRAIPSGTVGNTGSSKPAPIVAPRAAVTMAVFAGHD